ncbi:MAG: hypothetical protein IKL65_02360 [Bacilli bacterium]|nr:hypothetical protein [Bacilli bacterium]
MVISINDKIRKEFNKSIFYAISKLEQLDIADREELIRLFLLDHYKVSFLDSLITTDSKLIQKFNEPIEEIIDDCLYDQAFLYTILENSFTFDKLAIISKIIIMEELELQKQDSKLMNISKLHVFDKIAYSFNYDLESFKEYYVDSLNKKDTEADILVITFIVDKLLEYRKNNYNGFKKFILEFIKTYYKWTSFVKNNFKQEYLYKKEHIYLEIIDRYSLDNLISLIENNYAFLSTLVDSYLYYTTTERDISESIVEEYFYNNTSEEIQKKLQLKRD